MQHTPEILIYLTAESLSCTSLIVVFSLIWILKIGKSYFGTLVTLYRTDDTGTKKKSKNMYRYYL
ncbi:hypothetical protein KSF78_0001634 [Schistosoma japonicum]|nr:hypothetical protein KSF78_0001634 [Schistosoma japonicum]